MVILKNDTQPIYNHDFLSLYLKDKEPDCTLYSQEGIKFSIHKEVLYPAKLISNIFSDANQVCCKTIEIFCPCSKDEMESIVKFLYNGTISYHEYNDVNQYIYNITKMFGFPDKSFSVEYCSMPNEKTKLSFKVPNKQKNKVSGQDRIITKTDGSENFEKDPLSFESIVNERMKKTINNDILPDKKSAYQFNLSKKKFENETILDKAIVICDDSMEYSINDCDKNYKEHHKDEKKQLLCSICNESFKFEIALIKHTATVHKGKMQYECKICDRKFNQKGTLKEHSLLPHSYQCTDCEKKFNKKSQLNKHCSIFHAGKLSCKICGTEFKMKEYLSKHITAIHEGIKPFECTICNENFRFEKALIKHYAGVHEGKKPFQCNVCENAFATRGKLKHHNSLDHSFQCKSCDKKFVRKLQLKKHNFSIHQFQCDICKIGYISKSRLQAHVQSLHDMDNPSKCKLCNKKVDRFKRHVLEVHEFKTQFQCNKCDKTFKRKMHLKTHNSSAHVNFVRRNLPRKSSALVRKIN